MASNERTPFDPTSDAVFVWFTPATKVLGFYLTGKGAPDYKP